MSATILSPLFNINALSTGRRLFALSLVIARAEALGLTEIADHARVAVAHDD